MEFYYFGGKKSPQIKAKLKNESGTIPNSKYQNLLNNGYISPTVWAFKKIPSELILYSLSAY